MKENGIDDPNQQSPGRFESDTQKIVRRHLQNQDDEITDEDIRNVRIGITPPDAAKRVADEIEKKDNETDAPGNPVTPWDTVQP